MIFRSEILLKGKSGEKNAIKHKEKKKYDQQNNIFQFKKSYCTLVMKDIKWLPLGNRILRGS